MALGYSLDGGYQRVLISISLNKKMCGFIFFLISCYILCRSEATPCGLTAFQSGTILVGTRYLFHIAAVQYSPPQFWGLHPSDHPIKYYLIKRAKKSFCFIQRHSIWVLSGILPSSTMPNKQCHMYRFLGVLYFWCSVFRCTVLSPGMFFDWNVFPVPFFEGYFSMDCFVLPPSAGSRFRNHIF